MTKESILNQILARRTSLPVRVAAAGTALVPGAVYVARPDQHLTIDQGRRFEYVDGTRVRGVLSSANPLLESAAPVFRNRLIAVVLSGSGLDATDGVQAVKTHGGTVIAQDQSTSLHFGMPGSAIRTGAVDHVLPLAAIAPALVEIVTGRHAGARPDESEGDHVESVN